MSEDVLDNDDMDDENDEDDEDDELDEFPEFSTEDLRQLSATTGTGSHHGIVIEERTIPDLAGIVAIANKDRRPLSIEECVLTNARVDAADIDMFVEDSVFTGKVDFGNGVFGGKLSFCDATFENRVDFDAAVFKEELKFEDCAFESPVTFAGAAFEKGALFICCSFKEEITFDRATFAAEVDLGGSIFRDRITCKDAHFGKAVHLRGVRFEDELDDIGSNLRDMRKESQAPQKRVHKSTKAKKTEFNPWAELNRVSKKNMSRRDILRGVFRFLPERKEK